jgi:lipopolysaccharide transport system ATP-binding protein
MYVRLAFAVAAHLEPEILIVDEILAVGDASFQKKCLRKMQDSSAENGRTVLLVSHNMAIIQKLCARAILLDAGRAIIVGNTDQVVSEYISAVEKPVAGRVVVSKDHPRRLPNMVPIIKEVWLTDQGGNEKTDFGMSDPITVCVAYDNTANSISLAGSGFILEAMSGARVGGFNTYMGSMSHKIPTGGVIRFTIDEPILTPGRYLLTVSIGTHQSYLVDKIEHVLTFDVVPTDIYETGYILTPEDGLVALKCRVDVC